MLESTGPQNNYIRYLQKVFLLIGRGYHYGEKKLKTNKKNLICIHMSYLFDGTWSAPKLLVLHVLNEAYILHALQQNNVFVLFKIENMIF